MKGSPRRCYSLPAHCLPAPYHPPTHGPRCSRTLRVWVLKQAQEEERGRGTAGRECERTGAEVGFSGFGAIADLWLRGRDGG